MVTPGTTELIGGVILFVLIGLVKSGLNGKIREALDARRIKKRQRKEAEGTARDAHAQIPKLVSKADEIGSEVQETREAAEEAASEAKEASKKADRNYMLIGKLHDGETIEVGVEDVHDEDFLRGGGSGSDTC